MEPQNIPPDNQQASDASPDATPPAAFRETMPPADWEQSATESDRASAVGYPAAAAAQQPQQNGQEVHHEMGFFDHLEELRGRIFKAVIALVVMSGLCSIFLDFLMSDVLLAPATRLGIKLQNLEVMGQFTLAIQVSVFSGLILSIPFILWQLWGFIRPGLYPKEQRYVGWITVATVFCFLLGVSFAYFIMVPTSLGFTSTIKWGNIENQFAVSSYFSFVLGFCLACGAVFEMPMLSYALSRFGIINPGMLRKYRRHGIVVILILAAIITPTPDPINQMLLAVPLYALYEISILVSKTAKRQRDEAAQLEQNEAPQV